METMDKNYIHRYLKSHFVIVKSNLHIHLGLCIYKYKLVLKFRLHRLVFKKTHNLVLILNHAKN